MTEDTTHAARLLDATKGGHLAAPVQKAVRECAGCINGTCPQHDRKPTKVEVEAWAARWEQLKLAHYTRKGFSCGPDTVCVKFARKFAKIITVRSNGGGKSCDVYVNLENGDIIKGNWKGPIRANKKLAVRGSIFDADPMACMTEYGVRYIA